MDVIRSNTNPFGGVIPDPKALPALPEQFRLQLACSLDVWDRAGYKLVWLEIPITKSSLIPVAVDAGFVFHHSGADHLTLTLQLVPGAFIPPFATHYIGAGGVVLTGEQELLVVSEKVHRHSRPFYYKLPGGALQPGEHLVDGVIREVREETGIVARFESLACFRHWHGYRYGKSDIYFVCRLSPLTRELRCQEAEIEQCLWMPVQEYLASDNVGVFNKRVVQAALDNGDGLAPGWIEGYEEDPERREIFLPTSNGCL